MDLKVDGGTIFIAILIILAFSMVVIGYIAYVGRENNDYAKLLKKVEIFQSDVDLLKAVVTQKGEDLNLQKITSENLNDRVTQLNSEFVSLSEKHKAIENKKPERAEMLLKFENALPVTIVSRKIVAVEEPKPRLGPLLERAGIVTPKSKMNGRSLKN